MRVSVNKARRLHLGSGLSMSIINQIMSGMQNEIASATTPAASTSSVASANAPVALNALSPGMTIAGLMGLLGYTTADLYPQVWSWMGQPTGTGTPPTPYINEFLWRALESEIQDDALMPTDVVNVFLDSLGFDTSGNFMTNMAPFLASIGNPGPPYNGGPPEWKTALVNAVLSEVGISSSTDTMTETMADLGAMGYTSGANAAGITFGAALQSWLADKHPDALYAGNSLLSDEAAMALAAVDARSGVQKSGGVVIQQIIGGGNATGALTTGSVVSSTTRGGTTLATSGTNNGATVITKRTGTLVDNNGTGITSNPVKKSGVVTNKAVSSGGLPIPLLIGGGLALAILLK